jgi:hypothetical protein
MKGGTTDRREDNFYHSLRKYRPVCYSGKGRPTFLLLREKALTSLPCMLFINALFVLVIILEWVSPKGNDE